jgi:hypothetical protein
MPLWRDEQGAALPLALMAFVVLGALSAALLAIGSSEVQIASNHLRGTQAHFLAEAGLEHAFNSFRDNPSWLSTSVPTTLTNVTGITSNTSLGNFGSYTVQYRKAGDNTVLVVSTATSQTGSAQRVLRATMSNGFTNNDAIRTKEDLKISGNPKITGSCGSVHTNDDLEISGNPTIDGNATASDTYKASGSPEIGGTSGGGKSKKTIPAVTPSDFLSAAKNTLPANEIYQMKSDGRVLDGTDKLIATIESGQEYRGGKYNSGTPTKWDFSGNTAYDGTYYLEGNAKVSGNPGSAVTPWKTTIIATGDVELSGNPEISTHLKDTLFVAGLDIELSGNPTQGFKGLIAAHEQIKINGNPSITGYILAEDASATSGTVKENEVSGNPTITFDCGLNPPLQGPLQIIAWGL